MTNKNKIAKIAITMITVMSFLVSTFSTTVFAFSINNSATGYSEGLYDVNAVQPLGENWSRQSIYNSKEFPFEKWTNNVDRFPDSYFSDMVIGKGGIIYYTESVYGTGATLNALNPDGTRKWSCTVPFEGQNFNYLTSPAIGHDGTIYFAVSGNTRMTKKERAGSLVAVTPEGNLKWQYKSVTEFCDFRGTPILASNGEIYLAAFHKVDDKVNVIAISSDGKSERSITRFTNIEPQPLMISIDKNEILYISCSEYGKVNSSGGLDRYGILLAVDKHGKEKWRIKGKKWESFSGPVIIGADGTIYTLVGRYNEQEGRGFCLLASYDKNGKRRWVSSKELSGASTPVLSKDGSIYVLSNIVDKENPFDTVNSSMLDSYNLNGNLKWTIKIDGETSNSVVISSEGVLHFVTGKGKEYSKIASLNAVNPDGSIKWTYKTKYYSSMTNILLGSDGTLYSFLETDDPVYKSLKAYVLYALGTKNISININDKELATESDPKLISGRTMVPLRAIFEALGAEVKWDSATKSITGIKGNTAVQVVIGSKEAIVNGKSVPLDVATCLIDNKTYVQARIIAESFGASVEWDDKNKIVEINTIQ